MYSAGCIVHTSTEGFYASLISFVVRYNPANLRTCKPLSDCESVQMPFQQGTDPHCRWHFYWINVTTAIFLPYICMSECVCVSVWVWMWVCLIRSWQASIGFTAETCCGPNTRISLYLAGTISPLFYSVSFESTAVKAYYVVNMSINYTGY